MRRVAIAVALIAPLLMPLVMPLAKAEAAGAIPGIHHVWVVNLENQNFATTFGANSPAPYLSKTLTSEGAFLRQYYGIGHNSLPNYIAEISGQGSNSATRADCGSYSDFTPDGLPHADGQVGGSGCLYPGGVPTLDGQLTAAGLTWKGYMEDMGNNPPVRAPTCGHPAVDSPDGTQVATRPTSTPPGTTRSSTSTRSSTDPACCNAHVVNTGGLAAIWRRWRPRRTTP